MPKTPTAMITPLSTGFAMNDAATVSNWMKRRNAHEMTNSIMRHR